MMTYKMIVYVAMFLVSNIVLTNSLTLADAAAISGIISCASTIINDLVDKLSGDGIAIAIQNRMANASLSFKQIKMYEGHDIKSLDNPIAAETCGSGGGYDDTNWDTTCGGIIRYSFTDPDGDKKKYCLDIMFSMDAVDDNDIWDTDLSGQGLAIHEIQENELCEKKARTIQEMYNAFAEGLRKGFATGLGGDTTFKIQLQEVVGPLTLNSADDKVTVSGDLTGKDIAELTVIIGPKGWNGAPTNKPTNKPTNDATNDPTNDPTYDPTNDPTYDPTNDPTNDPANNPTNDPIYDPTYEPTNKPTNEPTNEPTPDPATSTDEPLTYTTDQPTTDTTDQQITDTTDQLTDTTDQLTETTDQLTDTTDQPIAECDSYLYINDGVERTYKDGQQYCQSEFGSDLGTIHDDEELTTAVALIGDGPSPWIGLISDIANRERERPYFFTYIDCSDCRRVCNGPWSGACVCGDLWEYGEPRPCYQGSRFTRIRIDTGKIDNDKYGDETLSAILCNCPGSTTCNNLNPQAKKCSIIRYC